MYEVGNKFYKYIVKTGNTYCIKKGNEKFGSYNKLSDALYERDRLIKANWDWEDALEQEETENFYEKMNLPRFTHDSSYIYRTCYTYKIFKDGECVCSFNGKHDAYGYAETIGGEVVEDCVRYRIQKRIDGIQYNFGEFKTLEEAKKRRDELIKNGWYDEPVE